MVKWTDFPEIKRALEEADNQGMLRGQHRLLVQVLRARFKRVPKELTRAIEAVTDPAALKELASVAATCPTLAAFRARLPS